MTGGTHGTWGQDAASNQRPNDWVDQVDTLMSIVPGRSRQICLEALQSSAWDSNAAVMKLLDPSPEPVISLGSPSPADDTSEDVDDDGLAEPDSSSSQRMDHISAPFLRKFGNSKRPWRRQKPVLTSSFLQIHENNMRMKNILNQFYPPAGVPGPLPGASQANPLNVDIPLSVIPYAIPESTPLIGPLNDPRANKKRNVAGGTRNNGTSTNSNEDEQLQAAIAASLATSAVDAAVAASSRSAAREDEEVSRAVEASLLTAVASGAIDSSSPEDRIRPPGMPAGLKNIGNTCYFNSLLQAYFMIKEFRQIVLQFQPSSKASAAASSSSSNESASSSAPVDGNGAINFMESLQGVFARLCLSNLKYVDPSPVLDNLKDNSGKQAHIGNQEDVTEFNDLFLERIQEALKQAAALSQPVEAQQQSVETPKVEQAADNNASAAAENVDMISESESAGKQEEKAPAEPPLPSSATKFSKMFFGKTRDEYTYAHPVTHTPTSSFLEAPFGHVIVNVNSELDSLYASLDSYTGPEEVEYRVEVPPPSSPSPQEVSPSSAASESDSAMDALSSLSTSTPAAAAESQPEAAAAAAAAPEAEAAPPALETAKTTTATKEIWFTELPSVLLFVVQRIEFDKILMQSRKINLPFDIRPEISMDRYLFENKEAARDLRTRERQLRSELKSLKEKYSQYTNYKASAHSQAAYLDKAVEILQDRMYAMIPLPSLPYAPVAEPMSILNTAYLPIIQQIRSIREQVDTEAAVVSADIRRLEEEIEKLYASMPAERKYRLHAVLVHDGAAGYGHYWSAVLNPSARSGNNWTKFNDSRISDMDEFSVLKEARGGGGSSSSAYCLVYIDESKCQHAEHALYPDEALPLIPNAELSAKILEENKKLEVEIEQYQARQTTAVIPLPPPPPPSSSVDAMVIDHEPLFRPKHWLLDGLTEANAVEYMLEEIQAMNYFAATRSNCYSFAKNNSKKDPAQNIDLASVSTRYLTWCLGQKQLALFQLFDDVLNQLFNGGIKASAIADFSTNPNVLKLTQLMLSSPALCEHYTRDALELLPNTTISASQITSSEHPLSSLKNAVTKFMYFYRVVTVLLMRGVQHFAERKWSSAMICFAAALRCEENFAPTVAPVSDLIFPAFVSSMQRAHVSSALLRFAIFECFNDASARFSVGSLDYGTKMGLLEDIKTISKLLAAYPATSSSPAFQYLDDDDPIRTYLVGQYMEYVSGDTYKSLLEYEKDSVLQYLTEPKPESSTSVSSAGSVPTDSSVASLIRNNVPSGAFSKMEECTATLALLITPLLPTLKSKLHHAGMEFESHETAALSAKYAMLSSLFPPLSSSSSSSAVDAMDFSSSQSDEERASKFPKFDSTFSQSSQSYTPMSIEDVD